MLPVEGHKDFYRDEKSGAIINCDSVAYSQYIRIKNEKQRQKEEIEKMKSDIDEIKSLLKELVNGTK